MCKSTSHYIKNTNLEGYTKKVVFCKKNPNAFGQIYETNYRKPSEVLRVMQLGVYPTPKAWLDQTDRRLLWTEYLGALTLSRCEQQSQEHLVNTLLKSFNGTAISCVSDNSFANSLRVFGLDSDIYGKLIELPRYEVIHGDLHPDNIVVYKSNPFAVDWDLATSGPWCYDALTLISSPLLKLAVDWRISAFKRFQPEFTLHECRKILTAFCRFKCAQLSTAPTSNIQLMQIVSEYAAAYKEYSHGIY